MKKVTAIILAEKIRKIYAAENGGDWVFEKGHIAEGKLLKQACEELELQNERIQELEKGLRNLTYKKDEELHNDRMLHYDEREKLKEQNRILQRKQEQLIGNLKNFISENA